MTMVAESNLRIPETFPRFSLSRLLRTVFRPKPGERVAILIDLKVPHDIADFRFLLDPNLTIQRHAYEVFYEGLHRRGKIEILIEDFMPAHYMANLLGE